MLDRSDSAIGGGADLPSVSSRHRFGRDVRVAGGEHAARAHRTQGEPADPGARTAHDLHARPTRGRRQVNTPMSLMKAKALHLSHKQKTKNVVGHIS